MQSHSSSSSKEKNKEKLKLPYRLGSMDWHGQVWWINYRDPDGTVHWENSGEQDADRALRLLAKRSLPRAIAAVDALREIIASGPPQTPANESNGEAGKRRSAGRRVRRKAAAADRTAGSKTQGKGGRQ